MSERVEGHPSVAVIGAGIGGLSAAAALQNKGIACSVFERMAAPGELGAGVQLAPNATRLLARWGLLEDVMATGVNIMATVIRRWDNGAPLAATRWHGADGPAYGAPMVAVHRADLHRILSARLDPARLRLDHRLAAIAPDADGVTLQFEGGRHERADIVVGADGIHSAVRGHLREDRPVFSGQSILRGLAAAQDVSAGFRQPCVQIWVGPGQHVVVYPVRGGQLINVAATVRSARSAGESWSQTADADELPNAYAGWDPALGELFAAVQTVQRFDLYDREPLERWSRGSVTLLGDAAHPMLPFFAQGANQAVEDAAALATALRGPGVTPSERLRTYEDRRILRTAKVQHSARTQTSWLHLPDGHDQQVRDHGFGHAAATSLDWLYAHDAAS